MLEAILTVVSMVLIGLQSWALVEVVKLKVSVGEMKEQLNGQIKMQIDRIVSDIESEKDSRRRVHMDFEKRLGHLEGNRYA